MTVVFFIFVALVIFHYVWEGIIAPSLRLEIRYEVFKLRDELRKLKIKHGNELDDKIYDRLQIVLNNEINLLHHATIGDLYRSYKRVERNKQRVADLEQFDKAIEECPIEEVEVIRNKSIGAIILAFLVNTGGWFIYVVPVLVLLACYGSLKALVRKLMSLSENDINKLFPPSNHSSAGGFGYTLHQ